MQFKKTQLVKILGCSQATEDKWIDAINSACAKFGIDTKLRLAAFIAQVGHESNRLAAVEENLNYSADALVSTWPSRFNTSTAQAYARKPMLIANKVYGGRMGNGQEITGDGWKYRGRGLIQCTGKSNYDAFSQACGVDCVNNPDSLAQPTNAALSAAWFWGSKGLNALADRGDFIGITRKINGGTIGEDDRERLYKKALIVLGDQEPPKTDEELDKTPVPPNPVVTAPVNENKTPPAQNSSIVEPRAANGTGSGKYPWNLVYESRSGHVTECDDTPGAERLAMSHRTGSYWEISPDGTFTHKSVLDSYSMTKEDSYAYTGGNHTGQVKGTFYQSVSGTVTYKTGTFTIDAPTMQFNTGLLNVSGEVNAGQVNAPIFSNVSGKGGMAFGNLLAKESIVAYYVKKGNAPVIGGSIGFRGIPGVEGNADGQMTNNLASKKPDGTPWITNGIVPELVSSAAAVTAGAAVVGGLLQKTDTDERVANAMTSAAADLDNQEALSDAAQTPVFMKHVTFDKPTLISMSTVIDTPDPSLYVNNLHTIVDPNGVGKLHMSDGQTWHPVGDPAAANAYTDQKVAGVSNDVTTEINARVAAIAQEAQARADAIASEAQTRQDSINQGLLTEAQNRDAAVTAEANARQTADNSLSDRILTLTASVNDNAAAIQQEQTARADAITAEANAREQLAATVDNNTASITQEQTTRANADTSITNQLNSYISTNDGNIATINTNITTLTNNDSAMSTRIDGLVTKTDNTNASLTTEQTTRSDADTALGSRIDSLTATVNNNSSAIVSEQTARANADSSLSDRIDAVTATANNNTTTIASEQTARANGDSALGTRIDSLTTTVNNNSAAITTEQTARANGDTALGSRIDSLTTTVNNNTSAITTEQTARANGDSANASSINTLSAQVAVAPSSAAAIFSENWQDPNCLSLWQIAAGTGELASINVTSAPGGGKAAQIGNSNGNDYLYMVHTKLIPFDPNKLYKTSVTACMAAGVAGSFYVGFVGVAADGTTLVAYDGTNTFSNQHYQCAYGANPGTGWTTYTGYTKGTAASGDTSASTDPTAPKKMNSNVKYLRVLIIANYPSATATTYVSNVRVEEGIGDLNSSNIASVQVTANANATDVGNIKTLYSVKLNANGYVAGYTLINNALPGGNGNWSAFVVQADQFRVVPANSTAVTNPIFSVDTTTGKAVFLGSLSVQSATSGQRTEIYSNVIKVFDANGTLRVKLGDLTA